MKNKLSQLRNKLRLMSRKSKLYVLIAVASIAVLGVATVVVVNVLNDRLVSKEIARDEQLRVQAHEFIQAYGTYTAETYPAYIESLKPLTTEEFFQKTFTAEATGQKQQAIQGIIETTVPDDFNRGKVQVNGDEAVVTFNANETTSINGEDSTESVDYTVTYTLQDGNWMVSNVNVARPF